MNGAPRILFVTPESAPWVKTGGLGDVSAALPAALRELGCDIAVLMPAYRAMHTLMQRAEPTANIPALADLPAARVLETQLDNGVRLLLLDAPALYDREAGPYLDATGRDWPDNHLRFGALSHAAAVLAHQGLADGWRPELVHCNDWPAALTPAYMRYGPDTPAATLLTIHNLAFQGLFPAQTLSALGLPPQSYDIDGLEFWGQVSFLKGGICYADAITAVSPNYAREIQGKELGFGLDLLLYARSDALHGIVNGIDTECWDPARDPLIAAPYDMNRFEDKRLNKAALQKRMGLPVEPDIPLLGTVGRITLQKGYDLIAEIAEELMDIPVQLVLLGSGAFDIEEKLLQLQSVYPRCVGLKIGFDEKLAHMIEAGSDMFLMPSRFEPCGLNQMYSQRYGTPPIANATGGLVDTIVDYQAHNTDSATGFLFHEASAEALLDAVKRAIDCYREPELWRRICMNGMRADFSWHSSAQRYVELYRSLIAKA